MQAWRWILISVVAWPCLSCTPSGGERSPFLAYMDTYAVSSSSSSSEQSSSEQGQGEGTATTGWFRGPMTLTFTNYHPAAVLDTSFAAWVNVSSVRTADQQDALLRNGYVQLSSPVTLGSAFTLPIGTFVYNGPGVGGATPVRLNPTGAVGNPAVPSSMQYTLTTPDVVLLFSQPPVSCDNVAFTYSNPQTGEVLGGASYAGGGYKTYAQVSAYQCSPFLPGLFLNSGVSTSSATNSYTESQPIAFDFYAGHTTAGAFCIVRIGSQSVPVDPNQP